MNKVRFFRLLFIVVVLVCVLFSGCNVTSPIAKPMDEIIMEMATKNGFPLPYNEDLITPINESTTRDDITLTVVGAYANSIETIVFFTMHGNAKSACRRLAEEQELFLQKYWLDITPGNRSSSFVEFNEEYGILYGYEATDSILPLSIDSITFSVRSQDLGMSSWEVSLPLQKLLQEVDDHKVKTIVIQEAFEYDNEIYNVDYVSFTPMSTTVKVHQSESEFDNKEEMLRQQWKKSFQEWKLKTLDGETIGSLRSAPTEHRSLLLTFSGKGFENSRGWTTRLAKGKEVDTPYGKMRIRAIETADEETEVVLEHERMPELILGHNAVAFLHDWKSKESCIMRRFSSDKSTIIQFPALPLDKGEYMLEIRPVAVEFEKTIEITEKPSLSVADLFEAIQNGDIERIQEYIASNPKLDVLYADGEPPLFAGIKSGNEDIAKQLLPLCYNVDYVDGDKNTALFLAIQHKMLEVAELLLDAGANPDLLSMYDTPLTLAAGTLNLPAVRLLVLKGAVVDFTDHLSITPLMKAAANWETEFYNVDDAIAIIELLLDNGADVNWVGDEDSTPLFYAIMARQPDVVELLLEAGANPNVYGGSPGGTPLTTAVGKGEAEIVRLLLEYGADTSMTTWDGATPLEIAEQSGHEAIVQLLKKD